MTPQQMSALGQHAAATSSDPTAKQRADAASAAYEAAEEQKKAAEQQTRAAREQAERQARQGQAYDAALRLFSTSITQLPLQILGNVMSGRSAILGLPKSGPSSGAGKGGDGAGGDGGGGTGPLEGATAGAQAGGPMGAVVGAAAGLVMSLGKILGDGFKAMLAAPTSGMQVFNGSVKLLAASFAPVLLPAIFLMSVAMLAVSEVAFTSLMPAFQGLADFLTSVGIPAIQAFVGALQTAAAGATAALNSIANVLGIKTAAAGASAAVPAALPQGPGGGNRATNSAISDVLAEMKNMAMSTPVTSGGSASAYTRAQTAVLGASPFEKRMQDMMAKVIAMMEQAARGNTPPAPKNEQAKKEQR